MSPQSPSLKSLGLADLENAVKESGQPVYRAKQIFGWLYQQQVDGYDAMTNVPAALRTSLADRYALPSLEETRRQQSTDGTIKFLFRLPSGRQIESVLIPEYDREGLPKRMTVCVSSQVGCGMGCSFCATGTMGFHENVEGGLIADQVSILNRIAIETFDKALTNVVFMGMGEPLMNYDQVLVAVEILTSHLGLGLSPRRVTVSTVGLAKRIRQLADDGFKCNLAVSLHAPNDEDRSRIMPINRSRATDLKALEGALRYYHGVCKRPVFYEYCMFRGFNDSIASAKQLSRIAAWVPCKINLIMYNQVDGLEFQPASERDLDAFMDFLAKKKIRVTVRRSRGQDIDAACGQLAVNEA